MRFFAVFSALFILCGCGIPEYRTSDVPTAVPQRDSSFATSGPIIVVRHSLGHSSVTTSATLNARGRYSESGRGAALPYTVIISMPVQLSTLNPKVHRRLNLTQAVVFDAPLFAESNRRAAISLAKEVLARTSCQGGMVEEGRSASGALAEAKPFGGKYTPGWNVYLRCTRWRLP